MGIITRRDAFNIANSLNASTRKWEKTLCLRSSTESALMSYLLSASQFSFLHFRYLFHTELFAEVHKQLSKVGGWRGLLKYGIHFVCIHSCTIISPVPYTTRLPLLHRAHYAVVGTWPLSKVTLQITYNLLLKKPPSAVLHEAEEQCAAEGQLNDRLSQQCVVI